MKSPLSAPLTFAVAGLFLGQSFGGVETDSTFRADIPSGTVQSISLSPAGDILVGGQFTRVNGHAASALVSLSPTGSLNEAFSPGDLNGSVFSVRSAADRIFVGGTFGVRCLNADGSFCSSFTAIRPNGWVKNLAFTPGGALVVAGSFSNPGSFISVTEDGSPSPGFQSGLTRSGALEDSVDALAVQPDGKIVVGGNFQVGSTFRTLARLNADGSVDPSFSFANGPTLYPKSIQVLSSGKLLLAGTASPDGSGFVRRLNSDGTVDETFQEPSIDRAVDALAVDTEGRIVIGGAFTSVGGEAHEHIARLSPEGAVDSNWTLGANNVVTALAVEDDGRVLAGGAFSSIGGVAQNGIARIKDANGFAFRPLSINSNGDLQLTLKGEAGRKYAVEKSTDLLSWTVFRTNTATADGLTVSAAASEGPKVFFRARLVD